MTPFHQRKHLVKTLQVRFPEKLPIILESKTINLTKNKFLVPIDINVSIFLLKIRKHISSTSDQSQSEYDSRVMYYLITSNNTVVSCTDEMNSIYFRHREDCGFLYLHIEKENSYG